MRGAWVLPVVRRPRLWPAALVAALRLAAPGWWHRWPPLPRPDPAYLRFRMVTNSGGDGGGAPDPADLVSYIEWCRCRRALRHRG
ncbi:MAG: hypothetical protein ACRDY3_09910 [Acidimicrobiales bacterium]